ncbi:MAG: 2OG-Fe(II) oxygenase [Rhodospirillaceae bacterium]|nr:MAG: 2OG-Fe(II) oxygenase [Rhodospirillaceae bacterium]
MKILDLEAIVAAPAAQSPYPHFSLGGALKPDAIPSLMADFPAIQQPGFFPIDDVPVQGAFAELLRDLQDPAFTAAVGTKLGLDLVSRPTLITVRKWSAAGDGRIHTDSTSKLATLLVYLNEAWTDTGEGRLRVLRSPKDFSDYAAEISPVVGTVFGFRRGENSWHGHLPFTGERRVVQITWLLDESKVAHKRRLGKFSRLVKKLNPFS